MDSAGLGEMVACYTDGDQVGRRRQDREHDRQDEGPADHHQARHRVRRARHRSAAVSSFRQSSARLTTATPMDVIGAIVRGCARHAGAQASPRRCAIRRGCGAGRTRRCGSTACPASRSASADGATVTIRGLGVTNVDDPLPGHRAHGLPDRVHLEDVCRDRDHAARRAGQGRPAARRCGSTCPTSACRTKPSSRDGRRSGIC